MENDNEDIFAVLSSFKNAIELLESKIDAMDEMMHAMDERYHTLESVLFDDIINPAKQAMDDADKQERFDDFYSRNGERLDAFDEPLRSVERDENFSLAKQAFDDYDSLPEPKMEESDYVDKLVEKVEDQLNEIKESLGLPADTEVEAKVDEDGEVEVKVDGEEITEDEPAPEEEEVSEEEKVEEEPKEEDDEIVDKIEEEPASEDELKALQDEAEEALAKAGKLPGRK